MCRLSNMPFKVMGVCRHAVTSSQLYTNTMLDVLRCLGYIFVHGVSRVAYTPVFTRLVVFMIDFLYFILVATRRL